VALQASRRREKKSLEAGIARATQSLRDANRVLLLPHVAAALSLAAKARRRALKWIELACAQLLADLGARAPFDRPMLDVTRIALTAGTRKAIHLAASLVALSHETEWFLAPGRQHERQLAAATRALVRCRQLPRKSRAWQTLIHAVADLRLGSESAKAGE